MEPRLRTRWHWGNGLGKPGGYAPALSGLDVLLQALIRPLFAKPKDAAWTNCAVVDIQ